MTETMIDTIPFDVVFEVSPPLAGKTVELTLEMASEDGLEEMIDMFDCLCALTQLGAFTADEGRPGAVWESEGTTRDALWRRYLSLGDVDKSFWRVLLQMSVQCHHHLAGIKRLSVREEKSAGMSVSVWELLSAPYLPAPRVLPFRLVRSDGVVRDVIAIRATTAVPIDDDEAFSDMKKAFEDWGSLVYVGGFASADAPLEEFQLSRVEVGRLHTTLIECAAIDWNAPKEALDCVIRICCGLHDRVVPIVELEIE
jgi:hypothetical protein